MIDSECYLSFSDGKGALTVWDFTDRPMPNYEELFMAKNVSPGMKQAMRGKGSTPKMTAGAAGGLGRLEKSALAPKAGSKKIK